MKKTNIIKTMITAIVYLAYLLTTYDCYANNIDVQNVSITNQVADGDCTQVQFDLTWENSWRTSTGPANWDAAYIFVKYKIDGGAGCTATKWQHATLSVFAASHLINNPVAPATYTITPLTDGKGAFIYRSADGSGSIDWQQVRLRWMYGTDGIADACDVTIKVMAIEMVYVPQASYYLGDGATSYAQFEGSNGSAYNNSTFQITGEGSITLGGAAAGTLGNNNATNVGSSGAYEDFNDATSKTLDATFPKGYNAFYCMKYECSQEQWMEFLNTLTGTQQSSGITFGPTTVNYFMSSNSVGSSTPPYQNGIRCKIAPSGVIDGEYVCDLDNDAAANGYAAAYVNETNADGRYKAVNYMNSVMMMAYLDWAALRPMTELEYEKANRGTLTPVINEYAWGTNVIGSTAGYTFSNNGATNESSTYATQTTAGSLIFNAVFYDATSTRGPGRCGIFANASSTRVKAGASYYGIMELSGNTEEYVVGVGSVAGRSYTGLHGNGTLTATGYANVNYWPGDDGNTNYGTVNGTVTTANSGNAGLRLRGGNLGASAEYCQVSNRYYTLVSSTTRSQNYGFRGVRTAP